MHFSRHAAGTVRRLSARVALVLPLVAGVVLPMSQTQPALALAGPWDPPNGCMTVTTGLESVGQNYDVAYWVDNFGAACTLPANTQFSIDWGDGTVDSTAGWIDPSHGGSIPHLYQRAGVYQISLIEKVSALNLSFPPVVLSKVPYPAAYPALAGQRVQAWGTPDIYLVDDDGTARHIPDPATYTNLFRPVNGDFGGIDVIDPTTIAPGPALSSGAYLGWDGVNGDPIYLVSNGQKRHIMSPAVMDKFWFNWSKVKTVATSTLNALPNGSDLT